jgi:hypothetical protein
VHGDPDLVVDGLGYFRLHWPLRTRDACTADVRL